MTYADLDINQKLNLKQVLRDWSQFTIEGFQASLDKNLYSKRVKRNRRTMKLRNTWYQQTSESRVLLKFLLYGRFVELGVGRGTTHTSRLVARQLREGRTTSRVKRPWYARKKAHEFHRLREILVERNINITTDWLESALTIHFERTI